VAKKDAAASAAPASEPRVRLSAHPRASRHIAAAKGWGGIAGFALVLYLSLQAGTPGPDALLRALLAGIGFSMLGWAAAVAVWRQLAVAEVHAARRKMQSLAEMVAAEAAERAAKAEKARAEAA
jgi:uncharacterized membrane protein YccC